MTIVKYGFPFRGHSAGLSVTFYRQGLDQVKLKCAIISCNFSRNSAKVPLTIRQTTSQLLRRFIATGRGGGSAVLVRSTTSVNITVEDCFFEKNYASSYGGGLFMGWTLVANHRATLNRNTFIENECLEGGAGGLEIGFGQGGNQSNSNQVLATNLKFLRNRASYGGGVYVFFIGESTEYNNELERVLFK